MPSSRFIARAVSALPLAEQGGDLAVAVVLLATAVSSSGMAAFGRTRFRSAIVSPASIDCACSRSPSILIVMPVLACSSRSFSIGRGPIWLDLVDDQDGVASAWNSPVSIVVQERLERPASRRRRRP